VRRTTLGPRGLKVRQRAQRRGVGGRKCGVAGRSEGSVPQKVLAESAELSPGLKQCREHRPSIRRLTCRLLRRRVSETAHNVERDLVRGQRLRNRGNERCAELTRRARSEVQKAVEHRVANTLRRNLGVESLER